VESSKVSNFVAIIHQEQSIHSTLCLSALAHTTEIKP